MGLINRLFEKIFGNNHPKAEPAKPAYNYMARWKEERQERIKAAEDRLRDWMASSLKEKGQLPFSWESGNDEAFVTFRDETEADEDNFQDLGEYIIDKLDIPDAGEFKMNGSGIIYMEDSFVKAKYSSTMKATIDYNEETEEEIYGDEEQDNADIVLFEI